MYSKAKIMGHSIHPMLVAFPVAFYTAALVTFVVYGVSENVFWYRFAAVSTWVGVASAGVAAVPGLIDWATGIPDGTRAKTTGSRHMVLNALAFTAFAISAVLAIVRWGAASPGAGWHIVLSAVGVALTVPAGFLGWELVQKHHVGVDLSPQQERLEEGPRRERAQPPLGGRPVEQQP